MRFPFLRRKKSRRKRLRSTARTLLLERLKGRRNPASVLPLAEWSYDDSESRAEWAPVESPAAANSNPISIGIPGQTASPTPAIQFEDDRKDVILNVTRGHPPKTSRGDTHPYS